VDVHRFAEPADLYEQEAAQWRQQLKISPERCVLLFAGKFEKRKRPIELMRTFYESLDRRYVLIMLGNGELNEEVKAAACIDMDRFRVLPFQNQSRMPVVYRLGDLFVLPSAFGETWGLAVNEALACGRPVLVSDRVGCAADVVDVSCGRVFSWTGSPSLSQELHEITNAEQLVRQMRQAAAKKALCFSIERTESALVKSLNCIQAARSGDDSKRKVELFFG
jgi:glycosyltransferase involved in cell wall biosynthesis